MPTNTSAKTIEEKRRDYQAAIKALNKKQYKTFGKLANGLKDYPLHSYLRYEYVRKNLWKVKDDEMIAFLNNHADLPMTESLRTSWLKLLYKRKHWQTFLDHYVPQKNDTLRCQQLQARINIGNHDYLIEDTRTIWLSGKSLPPQCDKAFELLYASSLVTNELVWQRIRLAMQNNKPQLAGYLKKRLDDDYQDMAAAWINIHNRPDKYTRASKLPDNEIGREILMHGIMRLAKNNVELAVKRVKLLANQYSFLPGEVADLDRMIAVRAAKRKSPLAEELLDAIDTYHVNDEVFHYRLRVALKKLDWPLLRRWTKGNPSDEDINQRWRYWHARALENTGDPDQANLIYEELSEERDYYGFLSADKLDKEYSMEHYPMPPNEEALQRVADLPAIQRAYELYMLESGYPARREWYHALGKMTTYQMQMAAKLATQWGWHDRAIFTMARANAYDDLVLRFPVIFEKLLDKYAKERNIDRSWVYGLVRAESAFIEDVRSPAGALGLMQVMPKTGQMTARKIGLKNFHSSKLKKAETNVPIGTAYMKEMLERFDGNMVLATAAYNAGPHRVDKWLPKSGCSEPDVWIEQIPFKETRKYVSRVLTYANIYDWRLKNPITPIGERMALITGKGKNVIANLSCTAIQISDNRHVN
ncbi:MAG: transglycosylase SLT domain-containing protein [Pseudomonadota bacterium]